MNVSIREAADATEEAYEATMAADSRANHHHAIALHDRAMALHMAVHVRRIDAAGVVRMDSINKRAARAHDAAATEHSNAYEAICNTGDLDQLTRAEEASKGIARQAIVLAGESMGRDCEATLDIENECEDVRRLVDQARAAWEGEDDNAAATVCIQQARQSMTRAMSLVVDNDAMSSMVLDMIARRAKQLAEIARLVC